jgi:hypothetical protein
VGHRYGRWRATVWPVPPAEQHQGPVWPVSLTGLTGDAWQFKFSGTKSLIRSSRLFTPSRRHQGPFTSKVCEIYKMSGELTHLNSVFLEHEPYIMNFEQAVISPKSPWSQVCLKVDSAKVNFNSQLCFNFGLWFCYDWVTGQQRPPWPPPIQSPKHSVDANLRLSPSHSFRFHTVVQL